MYSFIAMLLCLTHVGRIVNTEAVESLHNDLRQIHIITYHGASYPLNDIRPDETTELTASGEKQMYNLGLWIQQRYGNFLHNKDPTLTRFESSSHNRAVTSANAIALGLFNATSRDLQNESQLPISLPRPNVPIYTLHSDKRNDVVFRAADTCTSYQNKVEAIYTTDTTVKEILKDTTLYAILNKLSKVDALKKYIDATIGALHIKHLREVVDMISVKKMECSDHHIQQHACHQLPVIHTILNDMEWEYIQNVTYQIELRKYSNDIAGMNIGGMLLHTMIDRMMTTYQGLDNINEETHLYVYTTTDTTLWGIMAALLEQQRWFELSGIAGTILPHGSALIFELHGTAVNPMNLVVDLFFKPGNNSNAILIGTICGRGTTKDHCPLISLTQYVDMSVTKGKWCKDCENDSAEICIRETLKNLPTTTDSVITNTDISSQQPSSTTIIPAVCSEPSMTTAGSMILGILIGMFLSVAGYFYYRRRRTRAKAIHRHRTATTTARANTFNLAFDNADDGDDDKNDIMT